jgi:hypothetical protein
MQETEFSLCRPAPGYWCVECCLKKADGVNPCCNLGKLSDGSRGCMGHSTINESKELPELSSCKDFFCHPEILDNQDGLKRIREAILAKTPREFRISDFIKGY